ncbi:MAG: hypothetical protein P8H57_00720 [Emcibacteraceae bacterium]|nr:hypothetical protein [Emcibacteraceae bacterium]
MKIALTNWQLATFARRQLPRDTEVTVAKGLKCTTQITLSPKLERQSDFEVNFQTKRYYLSIESKENKIITNIKFTKIGKLGRYLSDGYSNNHILYYLTILFPIFLSEISRDTSLLPFHATVIRYENKNLAFLGEPGAGKSSVARIASKYGGLIQSDNFTLISENHYQGLRSPIRFSDVDSTFQEPILQVKKDLFEVSYGDNEFTNGKIHKVIYLAKGENYETRDLDSRDLQETIWRDLISAPEYKLFMEILLKSKILQISDRVRRKFDFEFSIKQLPIGAFDKHQENKTWQYLI